VNDPEHDPFSDLTPKLSRRLPLLKAWQARKASRAMWRLRSVLDKASKQGHHYSSTLLMGQLNRVSDFLYEMAIELEEQTEAKRKALEPRRRNRR
jgi:cob(I)alamin adenosyltransferase